MAHRVTLHKTVNDEGVIEVAQEDNIRALYFGSEAKQSAMDMRAPERLILPYTQLMTAGLIFTPAPTRILLIGLGGGSLAKFFLHHFPDCDIDAVEYRADVAKLAHGYFNLPETDRLTIHIDDGFDYLVSRYADNKEYDLILVDAFEHDGVAESIKQQSFFNACYDHLNAKGTFVMNLWNHKEDLYSETMGNIESAFHFNVLTVPANDKGNVIAFAAVSEKSIPKHKQLKANAQALEREHDLPYGNFLRQIRRHNRWRSLGKLFI